MSDIKLTELFESHQGEGRYVGYPMTFIRITGCPVGCPFCDTDYNQGDLFSFKDIMDGITQPHVCITGGEPLAHPKIEDLIRVVLKTAGVRMIHIETSGCYDLPPIIYQMRRLFWVTVSPKGTFLGAKKDFKVNVLEDADEVKWIIPGAEEYIEQYFGLNANTYIQPINNTKTINSENLSLARTYSFKYNLPISFQVHKLFNWR